MTEVFQVPQQLLVCIGIPLTSKNLAECQGRGTHTLESPPWAYELSFFMRLARQFDNSVEGERLQIEVVENAGNLESDSMRMFGDGRLCVEYPTIDVSNVVSSDIELLQLGDLRLAATEDFLYFFRQVFCLAQRIV